MKKYIFTYNGVDYVIIDGFSAKIIADILGIKKTQVYKMNLYVRGKNSNFSNVIVNLSKKINYQILDASPEEIAEYKLKVEKTKKENNKAWQEMKKKQPDQEEQIRTRREANYQKQKEKRKINRELKKANKPINVKKETLKKHKVKIEKQTHKTQKITDITLKEMIARSGGKNTDELQMAYRSVAVRLSKKFRTNNILDDMVSEAILTCGKYFIKNVNSDYNVFAYLTEMCKRSFTATFNRLNTYGKINIDEINI